MTTETTTTTETRISPAANVNNCSSNGPSSSLSPSIFAPFRQNERFSHLFHDEDSEIFLVLQLLVAFPSFSLPFVLSRRLARFLSRRLPHEREGRPERESESGLKESFEEATKQARRAALQTRLRLRRLRDADVLLRVEVFSTDSREETTSSRRSSAPRRAEKRGIRSRREGLAANRPLLLLLGGLVEDRRGRDSR